jgi:hypothetical protein
MVLLQITGLLLQAAAAGVNIEQVLLGPEAGTEHLLTTQKQLDSLLAAAAATQQQLQAATMARLTAKLLVSSSSCLGSRSHCQQLASLCSGHLAVTNYTSMVFSRHTCCHWQMHNEQQPAAACLNYSTFHALLCDTIHFIIPAEQG